MAILLGPPSINIALGVALVVAAMCVATGVVLLLDERIRKAHDTNLRQRLSSATVLATIVVAFTYLGELPFMLLVTAISAGCIGEFMKLVHIDETAAYRLIGILSGITFSGAAFYESSASLQQLGILKGVYAGTFSANTLPVLHSLHPFYILPILYIMLILIVPLLLQRYQGMSVRESFAIFAVLYFAWFPAHLVFVRNYTNGFGYTIFLILLVVCNDALAYGVGRLIGKTKLSALISPKKTREGAIAGFLGSVLAALCFRYLIPELSSTMVILVGVVVGIAAPLGDLIVSVIKRDMGVKDSGDLIPGHGGILDRCGSLVFAAPIFYYVLKFCGYLN